MSNKSNRIITDIITDRGTTYFIGKGVEACYLSELCRMEVISIAYVKGGIIGVTIDAPCTYMYKIKLKSIDDENKKATILIPFDKVASIHYCEVEDAVAVVGLV